MIKGIDHVVVLVKDLDQAIKDYTALGFTVVPGGEHVDGASHNALIAFADGTYIELFAFKKEAPEHRWWKYTQQPGRGGEGLIDFAILPTHIFQDIKDTRDRGLDFRGPFPGGRQRPDGEHIRWQTGQPVTPGLPFMCFDITPRVMRVPSGPAWVHKNGVTGIEAIVVLVKNLAETTRFYKALLGVDPVPLTEEGIAQAKKAGVKDVNYFQTFVIGPNRIVLTHLDANEGGELQKHYLDTFGEGPTNLQFKAKKSVKFEKSLSHNVELSASS